MFVKILTFSLLLFSAALSADDRIRVTFINPDSKGNIFWDLFSSLMNSAADDLNIDLEVVYSEEKNRFEYLRLVEQALEKERKPDYLVTIFQRNISQQILAATQKHGVRFFSVNTQVHESEIAATGLPRERFPNWLGQLVPDDVDAGFKLASALIEQAQHAQADERAIIPLLALSGSRDSSAAFDRNTGLEKAIRQHPAAELRQLVFTDWSAEQAYNKVLKLLERHPETRAVWAASDSIAIGAAKAITELQTKRNVNVLTGGIDWSIPGLRAVKNAQLVTSVGGHFIEGAIALVLLVDYHNGFDFKEELGVRIFTEFGVLDNQSNPLLFEHIEEMDWVHSDFKALSKAYNPALEKYDFKLSNVIR